MAQETQGEEFEVVQGNLSYGLWVKILPGM